MKRIYLKMALPIFLGFMLNGCHGSSSNSKTSTNTEIINENNEANSSEIDGETNISNSNTTEVANSGEENITTSSKYKVYVAESNESDKDSYLFFNYPILDNDKIYTRLYKNYSFNDNSYGMKVVEYDLQKFTKNTSLNTLLTNTIYSKKQSKDNINPAFEQRYYNLLKIGDNLYFSILPTSKSQPSQSGRLSYNLASKSVNYELYDTPVLGKRKDKTFDLTRGWFLPFYHNTYIAVIEEGVLRVFDRVTGEPYSYSGYDYLSAGTNNASTKDRIMPPVLKEKNKYFYATKEFYKIDILTDYAFVEYGERLISKDTTYVKKDILQEFKELYNGSKDYNIINYDGLVLDTPELILDLNKNSIYQISRVGYNNEKDESIIDLYLLKYDTDGNLEDIKLLEETDSPTSYIFAYQPYKYKDTLYFKVQNGSRNFLYSYDLIKSRYKFKYEIGNKNLSWFIRDKTTTPYILTGDTIILPDYELSSKSNVYDKYINIVFKVLDSKSGDVIETIKHKSLENLKYDDDRIEILSSVSNQNSLYFLGIKESKNSKHNLLIKIETPKINETIKKGYRIDTNFSGVYK